mgnify:CR=1 FL=1|tara:strand:+ start:143 stop:436 length:294 start_codon:yes stop_codon:yes gene_type:complete
MANPTRLTNESGEWQEIELTDEEVAEMDKNREEADKNIDSIRPERDRLLTMTDWTVGNDSPLSTSKQDEYKVYRTKLRDLPAAYSKVSEVVWPTPPS